MKGENTQLPPKQESRELNHFINDYLKVNSRIKNCGFNVITPEDLFFTLKNLKPFESPDMYANLEDKIVLIEHFEFDSSKRTNKGMKGKAEESLLNQRLSGLSADNEFHIDKGNYEVSLENWHNNFEITFDTHYKKIPIYKDRIIEHLSNTAKKEILVGFLIEDQYPPMVYKQNKHFQLNYFNTIQFKNKFFNSKDLHFVFFASYYEGEPRIFYFDRKSFEIFSPGEDLTDSKLIISPACKNEFVIYGEFTW